MNVNVRSVIHTETKELYINVNDMIIFWQEVKNKVKDEKAKCGIDAVLEQLNSFKNGVQS